VRSYASYEKGLLEEAVRLRGQGRAAAPSAELEERENSLASRLRSVLVVAEAYPELLANRSFLDLQEQLVEIENHLQMARRYYNGTVRDYNIAVESFPSNLVARFFGYRLERHFQVESATERRTPEVELR
jgi:LemA protein